MVWGVSEGRVVGGEQAGQGGGEEGQGVEERGGKVGLLWREGEWEGESEGGREGGREGRRKGKGREVRRNE